jgi:hypothetical protein
VALGLDSPAASPHKALNAKVDEYLNMFEKTEHEAWLIPLTSKTSKLRLGKDSIAKVG